MKASCLLFFCLSLLANLNLFAQKQRNKQKKDTLSVEERWIRDSILYEIQFEKQRRKDSLEAEKQFKKEVETQKRVYAEKWYPNDSLSYIDNKIEKLLRNKRVEDLDSLVTFFNASFLNPLHRARAIYYWISTHIKYDSAGLISNNLKFNFDIELDARQTFISKKGVCDHYSSLFVYLAEKCGLESVKISGFSKIYPNKQVSDKTDHAWNAVKIKNQWKLIDATWGKGIGDKIETFWFDTPPDKFIYSHFPLDSNYQFLKKKVSFAQYKQRPIIHQFFFLSKIPVEIPELGYFLNKNGVLQLLAKNTNRSYRFEFMAFLVIPDHLGMFTGKENWIAIPYFVKKSLKKNYSIIEAMIPGKGSWWIKVNITENISVDGIKYEILFPECMIFQVSAN